MYTCIHQIYIHIQFSILHPNFWYVYIYIWKIYIYTRFSILLITDALRTLNCSNNKISLHCRNKGPNTPYPGSVPSRLRFRIIGFLPSHRSHFFWKKFPPKYLFKTSYWCASKLTRLKMYFDEHFIGTVTARVILLTLSFFFFWIS